MLDGLVLPGNPHEMTLAALLGDNGMVLTLAIDSFLKYQLKRKPLGQDGSASFLKIARKTLDVSSEQIDDTIAAGLRYAHHELELTEAYLGFEEMPRAIVHADLVRCFAHLIEPVPVTPVTPVAPVAHAEPVRSAIA